MSSKIEEGYLNWQIGRGAVRGGWGGTVPLMGMVVFGNGGGQADADVRGALGDSSRRRVAVRIVVNMFMGCLRRVALVP